MQRNSIQLNNALYFYQKHTLLRNVIQKRLNLVFDVRRMKINLQIELKKKNARIVQEASRTLRITDLKQ